MIDDGLHGLLDLVDRSRRLVALTGAGCSTGSGIPDYRDRDGEWKRKPPVRFQQFIGSAETRQRYWARSMVGWKLVEGAQPNTAHEALAAIEALGPLRYLVTQNVDGLHQKAGSVHVNDLHGRVDRVCCLDCGQTSSRLEFQNRLSVMNPTWRHHHASYAPDGDAELDGVRFEAFQVPECARCRGTLKPDVVFFGESVPRPRVDEAMAHVDACDLLLVVGSSLMVWSGYRFVKRAREHGIPVAAVNLGKTRADAEIDVKVRADCGEVLQAVVRALPA
ncbi:MAG: NAD-dependent protein deacetylase [Acidobacteriota bacterium]|nr:MAG: NAD-dependent protein deacetylase [Acidobacteriota bacterium]